MAFSTGPEPPDGLSTHIEDVVNTILFEDLNDIVLAGHSYGGMVITGVADRDNPQWSATESFVEMLDKVAEGN